MATLGFGAILLSALAVCSGPLQAQLDVSPAVPARVSLSVCNAGKAGIDALMSKDGAVASSHVAPGRCAVIYENGPGAVPIRL